MSTASRVSNRTITAIQHVITGDPVNGAPLAPYRTGPKIIRFFNELGMNDSYKWGGGSESRWAMAESRLHALNGTSQLHEAIEQAVHPNNFLDTDFEPEPAVEYLNRYLAAEGLVLRPANRGWRVRCLTDNTVTVQAALDARQHASHEYIVEQLEKCDRKVGEQDFDGAITNARSLVEAVLTDIERRIDPMPPKPDGDLMRLFKRVQQRLNLTPDQPDLDESLKQVLRGLSSIVAGLAPIRNRMGDAHVRAYKPSRHHAVLAVNCAKTLLDFVYGSFEYQKERGTLEEIRAEHRAVANVAQPLTRPTGS
jgi:hypothetical protein